MFEQRPASNSDQEGDAVPVADVEPPRREGEQPNMELTEILQICGDMMGRVAKIEAKMVESLDWAKQQNESKTTVEIQGESTEILKILKEIMRVVIMTEAHSKKLVNEVGQQKGSTSKWTKTLKSSQDIMGMVDNIETQSMNVLDVLSRMLISASFNMGNPQLAEIRQLLTSVNSAYQGFADMHEMLQCMIELAPKINEQTKEFLDEVRQKKESASIISGIPALTEILQILKDTMGLVIKVDNQTEVSDWSLLQIDTADAISLRQGMAKILEALIDLTGLVFSKASNVKEITDRICNEEGSTSTVSTNHGNTE